jgi:flagellar L-ring protein precursor FlgH
MKSKRLSFACLFLIFIFSGANCIGGSIYNKRIDNGQRSIYSDDKAANIGDVLTIIISEVHTVDNSIERDLSKKTNHSITLEGEDNVIEHVIPSFPELKIGASSDKSTEGDSDYKDERSFTDKMTVVVEDVLPNGNLIVIGSRTRDVAGDKQTIQLSGIVRPRDIAYDNTVKSEQVANFKLVSFNEGITKDYANPGWLASLFDALWPF